jgi:CRISPR-associated protein Csb1
MVGCGAVEGVKPSSRIDPLQIMKDAGPVFRTAQGDWTTDKEKALKQGDKFVLFGLTKDGKYVLYDEKKDQDEGKPSKLNHGNVTPSLRDHKTNQTFPGGFTLTRAVQTTVLSLPALRRLRFPLGAQPQGQVAANSAARTTLAALGLAAATLARAEGADLRSRCQLFPTGPFVWDLLESPGAAPRKFELNTGQAVALLRSAIKIAQNAGLPWEGIIELTPSDDLVELVRRSQDLAAKTTGED